MAAEFEDNLSGPERELETALRGLRVAPIATLDPVRCAFEAGQRNATRGTLFWKSSSALLSLALAAALLLPGTGSSRTPSPSQLALTSASTVERATYITTRNDVLERGIDVLPAASGAGQSAQPLFGGHL